MDFELHGHLCWNWLLSLTRCSFSSQPSGAEIVVDGKYVGNTPSALRLSPCAHRVEMSLPGFATWSRNLEVLPGSDLSIAASMPKTGQ